MRVCRPGGSCGARASASSGGTSPRCGDSCSPPTPRPWRAALGHLRQEAPVPARGVTRNGSPTSHLPRGRAGHPTSTNGTSPTCRECAWGVPCARASSAHLAYRHRTDGTPGPAPRPSGVRWPGAAQGSLQGGRARRPGRAQNRWWTTRGRVCAAAWRCCSSVISRPSADPGSHATAVQPCDRQRMAEPTSTGGRTGPT